MLARFDASLFHNDRRLRMKKNELESHIE